MATLSMDLKVRLARRVAVLAACCLGVATASVLVSTDHAARAKADSIAELIHSAFAIQLGKGQWIKGTATFPDLQTMASAVMESGVCIGYRAGPAPARHGVCAGVDPQDMKVPELYAKLYDRLFGTQRESIRAVSSHGAPLVEVFASIDPQRVVGQSWREISRMFVILGGTLLGLCLLVYFSFAEFLRPTRMIRAGLSQLAGGDLTTRLPPFDLAELSAVGTVFNSLAHHLEKSLAERTALTQRLIELQDEERRHLARELHDEFGQCLAAIAAVAESAGHTARERLPDILPECESIARTAAHMMDVLRGALFKLRPADIDELGLTASLESLVSGWNARSIGIRFTIELAGLLDALPAALALSVYRVAQEALTNAAKHAQASFVTLALLTRDATTSGRPARIDLTVENDGKTPEELPPRAGMGLIGMRERLAALHGSLDIQARQAGGVVLRATFPVSSSTLYPVESRGAP